MVSKIEIDQDAVKSLKKIPRDGQRRILRKVEEYEDKPELIAAHLKRMTDEEPAIWRLRIAEFRAYGPVRGDTFYIAEFRAKKDV